MNDKQLIKKLQAQIKELKLENEGLTDQLEEIRISREDAELERRHHQHD